MLKRDKRCSREILTTEGYIRYNRYRMYAVNDENHKDSIDKCVELYGSRSVYPMDVFLGIDRTPFKMTVDMALRIARIGATSSSYEDASQRLWDDFELSISDDTIRKVVDHVSRIVLEEDIQLTKKAVENYNICNMRAAKRGRRPKDGYTLYVQADGAMFNTRPDSHQSKSEDHKKEQSSWKENKLGLVFRSDDLQELKDKDENGDPVYRIGKREYVCTTQGIDVFRDRLLYIMINNGLSDASNVVMISDGAVWLRNMRKQLFPYAVQILDLFHLKENVMAFGQYIYHNDKSQYYPWWKAVCKQLEDGEWREVLKREEISEYKTEKDTPPGVVNLYNYIYNNREFINYPEYRANGYFVGSGAIESGNKTVMQERLKLSGMKWMVGKAESLLALRAKLKSNLWDEKVVPLVRANYVSSEAGN